MTEEKKQRFIVKEHLDEVAGIRRKDIFLDEKLFEYEIDQESLAKAKDMGPQYFIAVQRDIQKHFLDSLSDFMGREITQDQVKKAIIDGYI